MIGAPAPGFLLVSKARGMTSRRAVDAVVRKIGHRRVGHAGTLDPFAEGLLLVLWDRATSLVPYLQEYPKSYLAVVRLGRVTDTQDVTGNILEEREVTGVTSETLTQAMRAFEGEIEQVPPSFSAVKHEGRRLYQLARKGQLPIPPSRTRTVHRFQLLEWASPLARAQVVCSTGTYVRTLAHDLGRRLGTGASLEALTRTAIGPFRVEDALDSGAVASRSPKDVLDHALSPAVALPDWPALTVSEATARGVVNGIPGDLPERAPAGVRVRVLDPEGNLIALYQGGSDPRFLRVFVGHDS